MCEQAVVVGLGATPVSVVSDREVEDEVAASALDSCPPKDIDQKVISRENVMYKRWRMRVTSVDVRKRPWRRRRPPASAGVDSEF